MVFNAPKWILSLIRPGDVHCKGIDRLVDWTPSYLTFERGDFGPLHTFHSEVGFGNPRIGSGGASSMGRRDLSPSADGVF
jgi:hypothetical protein